MALVRVLAHDQPDELARAYHDASDHDEQWRRALARGAGRMPRDVRDMVKTPLAEAEAQPS